MTACSILVAGTILSVWSSKEARTSLSRMFNDQQLISARYAAGLIEHQLAFIRKKLVFLRSDIVLNAGDPALVDQTIQNGLSRLMENGVRKFEIIDPHAHITSVHLPYGRRGEKTWTSESVNRLPLPQSIEAGDIWSEPYIANPGIPMLAMITSLNDRAGRFLVCHIDIAWFISPYLKNILSGKTGYAWVIDDQGTFLYHPDARFTGKNAFAVRKEKYPELSFEMINTIQKKKMIAGKEGTGRYFSGWHRGVTGKIEKLVAFCPIDVSVHPPRKWSVAVTAPVLEIEDALKEDERRRLIFQALTLLSVILGAGVILFLEVRWSRRLEVYAEQRSEAFKRSEEKYRSLVESAEDLIFTVNEKGRFLTMNSFTAEWLGGRRDELIGGQIGDYFPSRAAEKQMEHIKKVYASGKSLRTEIELLAGTDRSWLSTNFMPLKDADKNVSAVLCIARDITDDKNLEEQLVNTEKLASLGTLAAGVAHEINNPLGVILGFCDLLIENTDKQSRIHDDLKVIERQGLHCKEIVENLLSFSRTDKHEPQDVDLNLCLKDLIQIVDHTLELRRIVLITDLAEGIPNIKAEAHQLQQVFLNLVNNAAAAMDKGGVLKVRTAFDRTNRKAVVQIIDSGHGIAPENMDRIFDPFFTTKPEGEGTGLGLFVSYGIITRLGGAIRCVSHQAPSREKHREEGDMVERETTFTITLPV